MPFEHAEESRRAAALAGASSRRSSQETGDRGPLDWAQQHAAIIGRFGRYPHRNAILGRASTPEEIAFLAGRDRVSSGTIRRHGDGRIGLALFLAVAAIGALARWAPLPLPMLLVIGGAALSFVPGLSGVRLDPDMFFLLFVPLLLFGDGWQFPKREFVSYLRPILLLAFGLVAATVVVVGYLMHWLIPSLPLAAAFTLGAIVSPTDAVATAAVTARLPLPSRATHILNGESLINDASGLVAFKFAVAAVATGAFSLDRCRRSVRAARRRWRARRVSPWRRRSANCACASCASASTTPRSRRWCRC